MRERLGLSLREVGAASALIASKYGSPEYLISASRLSEIESKGVLPTIYRLYSLAVICRRDFRELLDLYGVPARTLFEDMQISPARHTHLAEAAIGGRSDTEPIPFDLRYTTRAGNVVAQWSGVPAAFLKRSSDAQCTFGYIGTEDFTMYPLIMPGSLVQVDERRKKVMKAGWRSEYERPIYFIETRDRLVCSWCTRDGSNLVVEPHPLSGCKVSIYRFPTKAEIIGQVVGVAMRLLAAGAEDADS
jgi:transcriptional regulator with XRE-family HTH domain